MLELVADVALRVYKEECSLYRTHKIAQEPNYAETVQRVSSALGSVSDKWVKPPVLYGPAQEKRTDPPTHRTDAPSVSDVDARLKMLHEMVEYAARDLLCEFSSLDYKRGVNDAMVKMHVHVIDRLSPMLFVK